MKLIFLHYFGGGPRSWDGVAAHFDADMLQTLDLREVGRLLAGYSVERAATDVMELVGATHEPFVLIGHSMGGKIAIEIAARGPQNLRGCVLIAPSPPTPEPMSAADRTFMLDGRGTREAAERIVLGAAGGELESAVWETALAANLAYADRDWNNWIEIGTREDISGVLPSVKIPILVIAGELDKGMPANFLREEIVEKIPGSQLEEIKGAGHLMPQKNPAEVARLIQNWIEKL